VAWNASYNRSLTPKGHIVVAHVPWFVDQCGICGVFGEDGCEALHVLDSPCRKMVRQMRNPEARHEAHTLHHTARSFTSVPDWYSRESSKRSGGDPGAGAGAQGGGGGGQ